jgi:hypothetical protein
VVSKATVAAKFEGPPEGAPFEDFLRLFLTSTFPLFPPSGPPIAMSVRETMRGSMSVSFDGDRISLLASALVLLGLGFRLGLGFEFGLGLGFGVGFGLE